MGTFVIVVGVLFAELSAADPPQGLYTAEGVEYVGCFEHGQPHHQQVLGVQIAECTFNRPDSCLVPASCIYSCQRTSTSYGYSGLKYPGQCFCDSVLRGVNKTDSDPGNLCDARCHGDTQYACGNSFNMLVYQFSGTIPQLTTLVGTSTANSVSYRTKPEDVVTTTSKMDEIPPSNTASEAAFSVTAESTAAIPPPGQPQNIATIAGAAGGTVGVLCIAGGLVGYIFIRRRKAPPLKKGNPRTSLPLRDVNDPTPTSAPHNSAFQPNPVTIDDLYAKPDKKKKKRQQTTPDPEDPSYQDAIPTGVPHQYATIPEDSHLYTTVRDDTNTYNSIQDDHQYASVQTGPKHGRNVEANPLYGEGSGHIAVDNPKGPWPIHKDSAPSVCEMVDNAIYE